ncbi:MAG: hypothetical protein KF858_12345 [Candidatus Sumerlaeia bacterium]|nr:hypothetical protein [Candidatus Sumerlaeia bacterium]
MTPPGKDGSSDAMNLMWVLIPTVAAFFFKFVWIVALAFIAMSYMIRTGREARWYLWVLHVCSALVVLRIIGYIFLVGLSSDLPPPYTSREDFVARHKPLAYLALPDWGLAERSVWERVQELRNVSEITPAVVDPFSGKALLFVDEGEYRTYYSIGPDQVDQRLEVKWDHRHGIFSPGDIRVTSVYVGDTATTGTL